MVMEQYRRNLYTAPYSVYKIVTSHKYKLGAACRTSRLAWINEGIVNPENVIGTKEDKSKHSLLL